MKPIWITLIMSAQWVVDGAVIPPGSVAERWKMRARLWERYPQLGGQALRHLVGDHPRFFTQYALAQLPVLGDLPAEDLASALVRILDDMTGKYTWSQLLPGFFGHQGTATTYRIEDSLDACQQKYPTLADDVAALLQSRYPDLLMRINADIMQAVLKADPAALAELSAAIAARAAGEGLPGVSRTLEQQGARLHQLTSTLLHTLVAHFGTTVLSLVTDIASLLDEKYPTAIADALAFHWDSTQQFMEQNPAAFAQGMGWIQNAYQHCDTLPANLEASLETHLPGLRQKLRNSIEQALPGWKSNLQRFIRDTYPDFDEQIQAANSGA